MRHQRLGLDGLCRRITQRRSATTNLKINLLALGPYRFVSYQSGLELVLEANPDYWRKVPHVKRLVFKSVPEATTRLAMLKKQEADVTYAMYSTLGKRSGAIRA